MDAVGTMAHHFQVDKVGESFWSRETTIDIAGRWPVRLQRKCFSTYYELRTESTNLAYFRLSPWPCGQASGLLEEKRVTENLLFLIAHEGQPYSTVIYLSGSSSHTQDPLGWNFIDYSQNRKAYLKSRVETFKWLETEKRI